jgi:peptidyl-prolyl cis-trans isomerase SurA
MNVIKPAILLAAALGALAMPLAAQAQPTATNSEVVGRIVAIVGDSLILDLNLEEDLIREVVRLEQQGVTIPGSGPERDALRRDLLDQRIEMLLIVQAALRDTTIVVTEADVQRQVQAAVNRAQQAVGGSAAAFEQALRASGMTLQDFREMQASLIRTEMLSQMYFQRVSRERQPPRVTDAQMRRFLDERREALGPRPPTISFHQVIIPSQPSDAAVAEARALADSVLVRIRNREDFATVARRFSDDEGTRDQGGDLGWFKRGELLAAFDAVVFDVLRPGDVSLPVRTALGFHIIKLERVRGSERQARHILIRTDQSDADMARARTLADSIAGVLRSGSGDAQQLHRQHGDPEERLTFISSYLVGELPPPYNELLRDARAGQVVGPFEITGSDGTPKWAVVRVARYDDSGEYSLEDPTLREQIRTQLERQGLQREIVDELRRRTYVEIRNL